ncbi:MAG: hypothetical protein Q8932_03010 [Bacteroidota bacterium]|nr:hypothetical protein [Bacteroidota bacterium]MDP4244796.1 hypothetical protein [Bacteroidota bacterium]MDP4259315.1 hypothetical protein [Bacteroidota bacterium]
MTTSKAMRGLFLLFIPILSIPAIGFAQQKLRKLEVFNGSLELMAPAALSAMSENAWTTKYSNRKMPELAISDANGEVSLVGLMTPQPASEGQLGDFKNFQKEELKRKRTDIEWLSDGVLTVNGKKVGYIKFLSTAVDQKVYNEYFFLIIHGKIAFFTFNCTEKLRGEWEKAGDELISSIKVH